MATLLVIPARYASTRYPGKPLVPLRGAGGEAAPLIERSWRAAQTVNGVDRVVVATDDDRIRVAATAFGAEVVMTSDTCRNGTERCAEALDALGGGFDIVVNLQGDAPLTPAWFVEPLIAELVAHPASEVATPVLRCDGAALRSFREDRLAGRVGGTTAVFGAERAGLYFSKEVIPYTGTDYPDAAETPVYHHGRRLRLSPLGARGLPALAARPLETLEGLEQLRFLERGVHLACVEVEARGRPFWELNNPEDVPRIEAMLAQAGLR